MSYNLTGAAYGGNVALSKGPLVATGGAATYSTTNAITYANKGQLLSKGAAGAAAPPATDVITGKAFNPVNVGESCLFAWFLDASGNFAVAQSKKVSTNDLQGGLAALEFPQASDAYTPFAYLLVVSTVAALAPWVFGTNNNAGVTGVTVTARDVMDYPAQPITG